MRAGSIPLAAVAVSLALSPAAAGKRNHFGLELSIGSHHKAGLADDLRTHRDTAATDGTGKTFEEQHNSSLGIAAVYERGRGRNRFGARLGWESVGLGHLDETHTETQGPFTGTVSRTYGVNGSHRFLSIYVRRRFFDRFRVSPLIGGGVSHLRATADVEETSSVLIGHEDRFAEDYDPVERWVPHARAGLDAFVDGPSGTEFGFGVSATYFFNARMSGFRTATEELAVVDGALASAPIGSGSRPFEADFSGLLLNFVVKLLY